MEHSSIQWIQIPTKDLRRAAQFYQNVFDTDFFFEELNGIPHAVFIAGENGKKLLNGALIESKEPIGKGVTLFFDATGNFETIVKAIKDNGGEIVTEKTLITMKESENQYVIPNTYIDNKPGYYAHALDSEGNKIGLYGSN